MKKPWKTTCYVNLISATAALFSQTLPLEKSVFH